jgi:hypothetical protein
MQERPPKQLVFGPVIVEWDSAYKFPIVVDLETPGRFITLCEIRYRYGTGDYCLPIKEDYSFDGASIPWLIRIVPGFARLDWHLLAALPHDYVIDHPQLLPRSIADGIFVEVLVALAESRKGTGGFLRWVQSYLMYCAVWSWNILTRIQNPPNSKHAKPPEQVVQPPPQIPLAPPALATSIAKEITKEETAEAPCHAGVVDRQ